MIPERLAGITRLERGQHSPDGQFCVMEGVAYAAGEKWTDRPKTACRVLTAFCIGINDRAPDDIRQRLIPYIPRLIGTRSTRAIELRRMYLLVDVAVREFAPIAMEHGGRKAQAAKLRTLPPIIDRTTAKIAAAAAAAAAAYASAAAAAAADAAAAAAATTADAAAAAAAAAAAT